MEVFDVNALRLS